MKTSDTKILNRIKRIVKDKWIMQSKLTPRIRV